jgi:hypothetical protein
MWCVQYSSSQDLCDATPEGFNPLMLSTMAARVWVMGRPPTVSVATPNRSESLASEHRMAKLFERLCRDTNTVANPRHYDSGP